MVDTKRYSASELHKLSSERRALGDYDGALLAAFEAVDSDLKQATHNAWIYRNLLFILNEKRLFALASHMSELAIAAEVDPAPLCVEIGRSFRGQKRIEKVIEWAKKGLKLNTDEAEKKKLNYLLEFASKSQISDLSAALARETKGSSTNNKASPRRF